MSAPLLGKLRHHLWGLFAKKYRAAKWYHDDEDRHRIALVPSASTPYRDVVRALDALRAIPRNSKVVKSPEVPRIGCKLANGRGGWAYVITGPGSRKSVEQTACMYDRVLLGSGAPAVTLRWKSSPSGRDNLGP